MIALPWKNGCVRTPFYHENNHYGFLAKCPTSFYNRPLFFKQWHDPSLEEKTASEMNRIYKAAVNDCVSPDDVFQRIFITICGTDYGNPTAMISALTIMAYFFQTCDIFEQPREGDAI